MAEQHRNPAETARRLEEGDEFQWIGEGWTDDGSRPPNRATVQNKYRDEGEPAQVIEIRGVQGGEANLYLYEDRDDVILYGSAKTPEHVIAIHQDPD